MTVITMSRNELTCLRVLIDVADGRLSVADATGLIGIGRRQIYRRSPIETSPASAIEMSRSSRASCGS